MSTKSNRQKLKITNTDLRDLPYIADLILNNKVPELLKFLQKNPELINTIDYDLENKRIVLISSTLNRQKLKILNTDSKDLPFIADLILRNKNEELLIFLQNNPDLIESIDYDFQSKDITIYLD